MTNPSFKLCLRKTYYKQGFFNIPVDFERYVAKTDEAVVIYLGTANQRIEGRVSRRYNTNDTPRIFGSVELRNWFQKHFEVLDYVTVEFLSPTEISITYTKV